MPSVGNMDKESAPSNTATSFSILRVTELSSSPEGCALTQDFCVTPLSPITTAPLKLAPGADLKDPYSVPQGFGDLGALDGRQQWLRL